MHIDGSGHGNRKQWYQEEMGNGNKVLSWKWAGMGIGMTASEQKGMGTVEVIPAHLQAVC